MKASIWTDLWDLFFPRCCVVCGTVLSRNEQFLCLHCLAGLPRTNLHLRKDNEVEKNFWGKLPVERATSFLYYSKGGDVRKLLYELKYYGNQEIGEMLGKCMAAELLPSGFFVSVDCIIPVPLHAKKKRQRGYNQSECLAAGISEITGVPVASHFIVREQYTATQTRKGSYERWENVDGIFHCNGLERLAGKHVLLVDDVLTTGATIVACADALKGVPGLRVSVLTLALAGQS